MHKSIDVLLADDSDDDIVLVKRAFKLAKLANTLHVVNDGEEALAYLRKDESVNPEGVVPGLVLLDINMPCKNGFEVLDAIKEDEALAHLPVIMLTTSERDEDIVKAYKGGACSYITKPVDFENFKNVVKQFDLYWSLVSRIPKANS